MLDVRNIHTCYGDRYVLGAEVGRVISRGRIVNSGSPQAPWENEEIKSRDLGLGGTAS
jgi:hypothetical protein